MSVFDFDSFRGASSRGVCGRLFTVMIAIAMALALVGCADASPGQSQPSPSELESIQSSIEAKLEARAQLAAEMKELTEQLELEKQRLQTLSDASAREESNARIAQVESDVLAVKARLDEIDAEIEGDSDRYNEAVGQPVTNP